MINTADVTYFDLRINDKPVYLGTQWNTVCMFTCMNSQSTASNKVQGISHFL